MRLIRSIIIIVLALAAFPCIGQENRLFDDVSFMADSVLTRYPGSDGDFAVRQYITNRFIASGLEVEVQSFDITEYVWGEGMMQLFNSYDYINFDFGEDFAVSGQSQADTLSSEYVVIQGTLADSLHFLMNGKIAIILPRKSHSNNKVITISEANQAGAKAYITVLRPDMKVNINPSKGHHRQPHSIPILSISYNTLENLIPVSLLQVNEDYIYEAPPSQKLRLAVRRHEKHLQAVNLIGCRKGVSGQYIIIGAHYDSLLPDPKTGCLRPGANDNASGVAVLLSLVDKLNKIPLQDNILFVAFGGEEKGLLGSMSFLNKITFDKEVVKEMINLDMLGLMQNQELYYRQYNNAQVDPSDIDSSKFTLIEGGDFMSDYYSFAAAGVPTSYFYTGEDKMIHTSGDTSDRLNYGGMVDILEFLVDYISALSFIKPVSGN